MAFSLSQERAARVDELITRYPTTRAALLPTLWVCQEQHGWISPEVIDWTAERLALSTAQVQGVATFYTMFFTEPVGEHVIWVCRTLMCDLRGGKKIQEHLEERLGCHAGQTSKDGKYTLLKAECLAACGQAPMVQIDDLYYENLDAAELDRILDAYDSGETPGEAAITAPKRPSLMPAAPRASRPPSKAPSVAPPKAEAAADAPGEATEDKPAEEDAQ